MSLGRSSWRDQYPSVGYVAPFLTVLLFISIPKAPALVQWEWPIQVLVVAAVCFFTWPAGISLRPAHWLTSILLGIAVFFLWIAPEVIYPRYRDLPLFSNSLIGHVSSTFSAEAVKSPWVLFWRTVRASTVVPIAEELFWRAWLMRWIANNDFQKVPLGTYVPSAFWLVAVLFGVEHGPRWDVGLITGIIYNFWMIRTKSVGDCILVHAITNLALSLYVIQTGQWHYW